MDVKINRKVTFYVKTVLNLLDVFKTNNILIYHKKPFLLFYVVYDIKAFVVGIK